MIDHLLTWPAPPADMNTPNSPDGALLGDGDLGATVGGGDGLLLVRLGKNDAWSRQLRSPVRLGDFTLRVPGAFNMQHDLHRGVATVRLGALVAELRVQDGLVIIDLANLGGAELEPAITLLPGHSAEAFFPTAVGQLHGWPWFERRLDHLGDGDGAVACAVCVPDSAGPVLRLAPGERRRLAIAAASTRTCACPRSEVQALAAAITDDELAQAVAAHAERWREFWTRGRISLPDPLLMRFRTAALAILGSATRPDAVAPGLFGPWLTTDRPAWHGDWHLNYNFQAPLHGVWASDHPELAQAHLGGLAAAMPVFRRYAAAHGLPGLFAPVCIGPDGILPEGGVAYGQRGNGLFCALPFIRHARATGDRVFLRRCAYPFLRGVADYWEAWLQADATGVLHVRDSCSHEAQGLGSGLPRDDGLQDLVHLRVLFANLAGFADQLGIDADRAKRWRDLHARLAPLPETLLPDGSPSYCLHAGLDRVDAPDHVPAHCAFPGLLIGPGSPPRQLELARNTLRAAAGWRQVNAFCQVLPAAVRVAYPGAVDLLRSAISDLMRPNGLVVTEAWHGGIETCGAMCAVDDMLMQSQDGVIHLFPVWDRHQPASFEGLRADGAFLVSAACAGGRIDELRIRSEQGGVCRIAGEVLIEADDGSPVAVERGTGVTAFAARPGASYRGVVGS